LKKEVKSRLHDEFVAEFDPEDEALRFEDVRRRADAGPKARV
jgi:hypothetical protein